MHSVQAQVRHLGRLLARRGIVTKSPLLAKLFGYREFGANAMDSKIIEIMGNKRKGYYVEAGANDGVAQSNTLQLELYLGWSGILVEPVPEVFAHLIGNRAKRKNFFVRAALVGFGYRRPTVEMLTSNLMSITTGVDTDVPDAAAHVRSGVKHTGGEIPRIRVPAMTLTSVLDQAGAPSTIDLFSLDVEGAELEVLKGIDFRRFLIRWLLVESRDIARISDYLKPHGYALHTQVDGSNFLFTRAPRR